MIFGKSCISKYYPLQSKTVAKFMVLVLTFTALHDLGPGYLRDHLLPYILTCLLGHQGFLQVPLFSQVRGMTASLLSYYFSTIMELPTGEHKIYFLPYDVPARVQNLSAFG